MNIETFLNDRETTPVIDVRSPGEYAAGHIPHAINVPLFNDEERAIVGTTYKQEGHDPAVRAGLSLVGPKLNSLIDAVSPHRQVLVHCWRGGMRSASMGWLLNLAGIRAQVLEGGYKNYRHTIRERFMDERRLIVVGGMTGSGKTDILRELKRQGEQVIDLEGLAHHKGSAFGALGQGTQPTTEQFENDLFDEWYTTLPTRPIYIEDESLRIGTITLPPPFFDQMKRASLLLLDVPSAIRVERLVREYASFPTQELNACVTRIEKKLGGDDAKAIRSWISEGDVRAATVRLLAYYDRLYAHSQTREDREKLDTLPISSDDPAESARKIQEWARSHGEIR